MNKPPKAIVTGAAGFIGSHLVNKLLSLGYSVIGLDDLSNGKIANLDDANKHENFKFICVKVEEFDFDSLGNDFDYLFHLAGLADIVPSIREPEKYFIANTYGTFRIVEYLRKNTNIKIIYAASSSCYGLPEKFPTAENETIRTEYPYALSKFQAEEIIIHFSKVYGIKYISLRLFNVYGPRSRTNGTYGAVMGVFLAQFLANEQLTIVGDGNQSRDFIYVDDVVEAFIIAARSTVQNEIFNIGKSDPRKIIDLAYMISDKYTFIPKRPGEPDMTWANISKAQDLLGWHPKISLEEGIELLKKNLEYWKNAPVWTPSKIQEVTADWFRYLK
jgi:UDP-glucose 4-epimerase